MITSHSIHISISLTALWPTTIRLGITLLPPPSPPGRLSVIGVVFPNIRDKCACLGIKAPKELARHKEEILWDEPRVRDDDDVLLGYS